MKYRLADVDLARLGREAGAVVWRDSGRVTLVDLPTLTVLERCGPERSVAEHVNAIHGVLPAAPKDVIRATLQAVIEAGLLRPAEELPAAAPSDGLEGRIGTLGVVTADRPEALRRCLASYVAHGRAHGHDLRVIVADGSHESGNGAVVRSIASGTMAATGTPIVVIGTPEVDRFCHAAVSAGLPARLVHWLLRPGRGYAAGAVRNRILLASAGSRVLTVDDDTVCHVWCPPEVEEGVDFVGHDDPRDTVFFEDRGNAVAVAPASTRDLLSAHGHLLGRALSELTTIRGGYSTEHACTHVLHALYDRAPSAATVRVTWAGLAGDAAVYCPYTALLATGRLRESLTRDESTFHRAMRSREVRRGVRRSTVADGSQLMLYCAALDNTQVLPPFGPANFNEDGLFAVMLRACEPSAFIAQIPIGIVHDSHRGSGYEGDRMLSACEIRLTDVLCGMARQWASAAKDRGAEERMTSLGRYLMAWSRLDPKEFRYELTRLVFSHKAELLKRCESLLGSGFAYPDYWKQWMERYYLTLRASVNEPGFWIPKEQQTAESGDALLEMRTYVGMMGEALTIWPELWRVARTSELCSVSEGSL
jgi:hypothetical protein